MLKPVSADAVAALTVVIAAMDGAGDVASVQEAESEGVRRLQALGADDLVPVLTAHGAALIASMRLADQANALSLLDEQTGLPNRRGFVVRAEPLLALAARLDEPSSFLVVDLPVVAEMPAAELAARNADLAGVIVRTVREADLVGRWGTAEFAVLLTRCLDPVPAARRLLAAVAEATEPPEAPLHIYIRVATTLPTDYRPVEERVAGARATRPVRAGRRLRLVPAPGTARA